jgi:hypothetical protein
MTSLTRARTLARLSELDDRRLALLQRIADQLLVCNDPDLVETFVAWRADPRIESILCLAATFDDDRLDQLLFTAEDLYAETQNRSPRARA